MKAKDLKTGMTVYRIVRNAEGQRVNEALEVQSAVVLRVSGNIPFFFAMSGGATVMLESPDVINTLSAAPIVKTGVTFFRNETPVKILELRGLNGKKYVHYERSGHKFSRSIATFLVDFTIAPITFNVGFGPLASRTDKDQSVGRTDRDDRYLRGRPVYFPYTGDPLLPNRGSIIDGYLRESFSHLREALDSVSEKNILKPGEWILLKDKVCVYNRFAAIDYCEAEPFKEVKVGEHYLPLAGGAPYEVKSVDFDTQKVRLTLPKAAFETVVSLPDFWKLFKEAETISVGKFPVPKLGEWYEVNGVVNEFHAGSEKLFRGTVFRDWRPFKKIKVAAYMPIGDFSPVFVHAGSLLHQTVRILSNEGFKTVPLLTFWDSYTELPEIQKEPNYVTCIDVKGTLTPGIKLGGFYKVVAGKPRHVLIDDRVETKVDMQYFTGGKVEDLVFFEVGDTAYHFEHGKHSVKRVTDSGGLVIVRNSDLKKLNVPRMFMSQKPYDLINGGYTLRAKGY